MAKRGDGVYRPGTRSPGWVKATAPHVQACVVGGWRPENVGTARVSATRVGALLLGVPARDGPAVRRARSGPGWRPRWRSAPCAGGSSTSDQLAVRRARPPCRMKRGRAGASREFVVEVSHMGWTEAGKLRAPVYRGIRDDLRPADVRQED